MSNSQIAWIIARNTYCANEFVMFHDCDQPDKSPIKERLRVILDNKIAEFNRVFSTLRTDGT